MQSNRFEILTTRDTQKWNTLLKNVVQNDIYYTPEYSLLFEENLNYEAKLFFYGNDENYIIYPFWKKKINDLSFCDDDETLYDITSPWYYGGFLSTEIEKKNENEFIKNFLMEFHNYCKKENIVTEFNRLHPFIQSSSPLANFISIDRRWKIVYVDLKRDEQSLWNSFKKENRKAIRKAEHNNIEVYTTKNKRDIEDFYRIYTTAMERKNANEFYYFSSKFFNRMFELLGNNAQLFVANHNDEMIAGSVLVGLDNFAHDYLRASLPEFLNLRPNNLLVHNKIKWAKNNNYKYFSLQGGNMPNDGISRFKLTFSQLTQNFYTYSKIHDEEKYKNLYEKFEEFNKKQHIEKTEDYFPAYRR